LHPEAYIYCLPNVSRFLGGDAIGDILTSNIHQFEGVNLIVDLGTNGEVILVTNSGLFLVHVLQALHSREKALGME